MFAKKVGTPAQYKHALEILLPTSPVYEYLEGRIPNPAYTFIKIASISETSEKERINTEIGQRRTRLGAKIDQVIREVKREVFEASDLESLYSSIIDWTHDDETRRQYEEKLLQHAYNALVYLEDAKKSEKRELVQELARGLVILKHPFALAWKIVIEWKDVDEIQDLDVALLREYVDFFPEDGLSKVLQGYLDSDISPFPTPSREPEEIVTDESAPMTAEDRLMLMTEGVDDNQSSILSHRLVGEYFSHLGEYDSAAMIARKAQKQIVAESKLSGLGLTNSLDATNIILATALVYYQAPRHHPEARSLFDQVLLRRPAHVSALIGVGLILEEQEDYVGAIDFFNRALERKTEPRIMAEAAWCKALSGDRETGLHELRTCLPQLQGSDTKSKRFRAQTFYRIGVCIWEGDKSKTARKDRNGAYAEFISALQTDLSFAPSYTSLGIYYADYARDKKRARKCFQKAFELSAAEVDAAERLARSFANTDEWDLVEAVAQRVIESGKVKPAPGSKKKAVSWPFVALGVVQLNRQDYVKSVVSFQSAIRSSPENYHAWVGLGESYHNSGRYIAATRALEQAQRLNDVPEQEPSSGWFCTYMIANVKRELGEFEAAVVGYEKVLRQMPLEFGVAISLLQTLVESAWRNVEFGMFKRAANLLTEAVDVAAKVAKRHDVFNLWKVLGDACSIISWTQAYAEDFPSKLVGEILEANISLEEYEILTKIDKVGGNVLPTFREGATKTQPLKLAMYGALLAHKRAIHTCVNDTHAQAVAWYNLGWSEYRAHGCNLEDALAAERRSLRFLKASVQCFKKAIELEAGNSEFWNSLGIVTAELSPKVSQHSFVRSLHINERSARVWTNLGAFYLLQDDRELANQAFARAQSTDPDYAHAWLGQGILAAQLGEAEEARTLFTHAFEISDSSSLSVKREYVISTFDYLQSLPASKDVVNILQPRFALQQLRCQQPNDLIIQHITSLFAERTGDLGLAVDSLQSLCSELESKYETLESTILLSQFVQAKSDLSRAQLANNDFASAVENAETSLDLSADEQFDNAAGRKIRLSAHIVAGLAYYHEGSIEPALDMFRNALENQEDPDIICLLVQVLWAKGDVEARSVARDQLLDCVERFPTHFDAKVLLSVIAFLEDNINSIRATLLDIENLRTRDSLTLRQQRRVTQLLGAIATLETQATEDDLWIAQATIAVMLSPSQPHGWVDLAASSREPFTAEMAALTAAQSALQGKLDVEDLCIAFAESHRLHDMQKAIMVAPWMAQGWAAFGGTDDT